MKTKLRGKPIAKGQGIIEFALVMPILLLLLMGVIEFGWMIVNYVQLYNGLREGLRYGSVSGWDPSKPQYEDCDGIKARVQALDPSAAWETSSISITYDAGDNTIAAQVGTCPSGNPGYVKANPPNRDLQEDDRIVITVNVTIHYLTPIIATFIPSGLPMTFEAARTIYPNGVPLNPPPPGG